MRDMQGIQGRLNEGLWRPLERPALAWIVARLPAAVTPDHLTVIGIAGAFVAFAGYVLSARDPAFLWLANAGLAVNWFGDSLDGTLARYRRIERRRYGFFIDHSTDLLSEVLLALGLGLSSYVRFEVACLALIAYLLMAVLTFVQTVIKGTLQIAFAGIGPTEVRVGMIILNLLMLVLPSAPVVVLWAPLSIFDLIVLMTTAAAFGFFLIAFWREARRLALDDPAPGSRTGRA